MAISTSKHKFHSIIEKHSNSIENHKYVFFIFQIDWIHSIYACKQWDQKNLNCLCLYSISPVYSPIWLKNPFSFSPSHTNFYATYITPYLIMSDCKKHLSFFLSSCPWTDGFFLITFASFVRLACNLEWRYIQ